MSVDTLADLNAFAKKYLSLEILPHQEPWVRHIENNTYALLLAPREHGKSTTFRTWLLWKICNDPSLRVLIAAHKEELADEFARDIIMHLEREDLQADFGFQQGRPWRLSNVFLQRVDSHTTTATLSTAAKQSGVTGKRFDIIVMDDILTVDSVQTENRRRKMQRWINKELFPALDHNAKRKWVVIGTRKHIHDWYSQLLEMPHWHTKIDRLFTEEDGEKTYLWPERFNQTVEDELRAQMSPDEFSMEYLNEPVASEGNRFKRAWIEPFFYEDWRDEVPERFRQFYIGIDPSMGSKTPEASYAALAVVCFDSRFEKQDIYVVDMVREKLSLGEQEDLIKAKVEQWRPEAVMIEAVFANKHFADRMMAQLPILEPVIYRGYGASSGLQGTTDVSKFGRIENIVGWLFKNGKIHLKDPDISPMSKMFIEAEYLQFPEGSLDLLDALNMAVDRIDARTNIRDLKVWMY